MHKLYLLSWGTPQLATTWCGVREDNAQAPVLRCITQWRAAHINPPGDPEYTAAPQVRTTLMLVLWPWFLLHAYTLFR